MKKPFLKLAVASALLFSNFALAQNELPTKIQAYFDTYQKEYPVEKSYLHLDKHTYTLGEDLWFSAYLTAGSVQIPSPLSMTLYVDLFDGDGLLLEQKIVRLETGRGQGDFQLPEFGKPGTYRIKAYTAWMRNFGEEYFFTKDISVVDGAGGSFLPEIKFNEISSSEGKTTYRANLIAIDSKGNPLANKNLEVKALGGEEELYSQNLTLNTQGQVSFTFSIPEKSYPSQNLELTYLENENYSVIQKVRLPYSLSLADIQFLPEGGHWIVGKKSQMAFRGIYPDGMPAEIQGEVVGGSGISFESNFGGLGKFEITPEKADYQAKITAIGTGQQITIDLPKADTDGLVLQVVNNPAASYITAFVQGNYEPNSLLLVSQTRGIINYMIQGALANGVWGVRIPKENLISGINQITVFSGDGKPLLERLIFFQKDDRLKLDLSQTGAISVREKLNLELKSSLAGQAMPGSFSISIVDADQAGDENLAGDIFSSLLLTSDLHGSIYRPGHYFKDLEKSTHEALDLVMLTHGWRRFEWSQVLAGELPKVEHFIERGINIEGQVTDQEDTKKGLGGGKITALVGEGVEIVSSEYGPNGRFIFRDMDYLDSAQVTITAEDIRLKNFINVDVESPKVVFNSLHGKYPNQISWPKGLIATYQERTFMQRLNEELDVMDLEGVTVEAQTIEKEEEEIKKIYGAGDVTIDPEKIPASVGFTNVFQLIQGRVSGVQVVVNGLNASVTIRGVGSLSSGTEPLYLLDNMPVDAGTLLQVNPRDVANVDVFKDPAKTAIFGAQGANGVIAVYTKTGAGVLVSVGGTLVTRYGGYSVPREFYQPKYDTKNTATAATDKRATIYWNPLLKTDANGTVSLDYFNTDVAKRQLLILEGMDAEGRLGRLVRILE
ncbi:MAG: TonB-dependent receptor plug domain-containing protein [Algoriphagus sp.]|nr:TonB-dependent receptor plug domain-containing protein [Algoriphagus sp.]